MAKTAAISGNHIQFDIYEEKNGEFGYATNFCVRITDSTLFEILKGPLQTQWKGDINPEIIKCHTGDFSGEVIDLSSKPKEIEYISQKLRQKEDPTLIIIKEPRVSSPDGTLSPEVPEHHGRTLSTYLRQMIRSIHDPNPLPRLSISTRGNGPRLDSVGEEESLSPSDSFSGEISSSTTRKRKWIKRWRTVDDRTISMGDIASKVSTSDDEFLSKSASTTQYATLKVTKEVKPAYSPNFTSGRKRSMQVFSSLRKNDTPSPITPSPITPPPDQYLSTSSPPMSPPFSPPPSPFSPPPDIQRKKASRISKLFPSAEVHVQKKGEISEPVMEISSPQQKEHMWKYDRKSQNRTAKRGNKDRFRLKKKQLNQMPDLTYASFEIHEVMVHSEDTAPFTVSCREFHNVGALRTAVHTSLKKLIPMMADHCPNNLSLTYEIDGTTYELFNDYQFIFKTALYEHCRDNNIVPLSIKVDLKETNWELPTLYRLSKITGVMLDEDISALSGSDTTQLAQVARNDKREMEWARRTLHSYVDEIVRARNPESYSLSMEVESGEAPMLLALKIPIDNKVEITFHYKTVFTLVRRVSVNKIASSVLESIFSCVLACDLVENDVSKYILQVTGKRSYLHGANELITFRDIRRCILKSEPIHLSITLKPTPEEDTCCKLNWLPIDPYSGAPPLHTDISRGQMQGREDIWGVSMWDQSNEFGIILNQVENLPIPMSKDAKKLYVAVEATLFHANEELKSGKLSSSHHLSSNGVIEWQEAVLFGLQIKNLPRAAKIMIVVRDVNNRKDSASKKKQQQILFWGTIPVFDHRGLLQSGQHTMMLWRGPMSLSKGEMEQASYEPNPCAPCNNNPDPGAVKVTIQLSRNTYPVFFPSSAPETCSLMLSKEEDAGAGNVRKQFEKLQDCLKNGQLPMSAFPSYIARIDWSKLPQVIEVYALLQQVEAAKNLPVETALKLLDGDFADEKVRAFAVRVLDTLPDEQLIDFLLQLTQAIKFEPSHDSALARLLLKRSLNNKMLGHFFFWYLKCEMYNPQFTPRFAVIMEAYLKGCGESMLKRFEKQVEMQMTLEDIGKQVEHEGGNDSSKMQSILQDLLRKRGIPEQEITPVYNPRLRLGNLNPAKCKIMQSKKKPQWLEMVNIDPTALRPVPTKLILKIGDDLRQDMIVLRMLSLLEKLWEREGLPDLHLIPYGCMATGPNTGFIEVVNARTIADVSGVNDNKKLYEWIKSHQKNEYGEDDPVKLQNAIKTFTHSCAGYTVASYVLGIGDRHNDNIMITKSGNLFHIDFGHFLGRIKHFLGVKREWAPFVLTPDFVYVMGGENSDTFNIYKNLCCRAFLCLRRHHELIFNLFSLMRSTGIPELACMEDANYIRDALMVTRPEHEAEQEFRQLIKKCLDLQWTVQIMWWIHVKKKGASS